MNIRSYSARRRPLISTPGSATTRRHKPDYMLLMLSVLLLGIGLMVVYAISPGLAAQQKVGENYYFTRQLAAIILGIIAFVGVCNMPVRMWRKFEMPLLVAAGAASVAVRLFGERINGAYRWIQIGGFSFQAAELIKFALIIWLAGFLSDRIRTGTLEDSSKTLKVLIIAFGIIAVVVAILQSDFGSTAVMIAIMGSMSFVAGLPLKKVLMIGAVIGVGAIIVILPFSYRRQRLQTFFQPARDCQNTGYQSCQALIAVGSGGIIGLGIGGSVQAYGYLPEAANDSIFAIYAEKFGFIGTAILIGLFGALLSRMAKIMERAPDDYSRLLVTGIVAWLSTQAIINVGAMLGLLPLKGITLPFISYGGTSIIFVTLAIGVVFSISRYTTYRYESNTKTDQTSAPDYRTRGRGERRPYYATPGRSR